MNNLGRGSPRDGAPAMTIEQMGRFRALARCTFLPGHPDKRFVHAFAYATEETGLTPKQEDYLDRLSHRYRRQLGGCQRPECPDCPRVA